MDKTWIPKQKEKIFGSLYAYFLCLFSAWK